MVYGHQQWSQEGLREASPRELDFLYYAVTKIKKAEAEASEEARENARRDAARDRAPRGSSRRRR